MKNFELKKKPKELISEIKILSLFSFYWKEKNKAYWRI